MNYPDLIAIFNEVDRAFMTAAFAEGIRCRAMEDGHYHPIEDLEFLMMFCGYAV